MEYDNAAQAAPFPAREYAAQLGAAAPRPADLGSLQSQLESCVARAAEASERIRNIGDRVFGPRPEAADASGRGVSGPPTLAMLVEFLGDHLTRIESGLNRL